MSVGVQGNSSPPKRSRPLQADFAAIAILVTHREELERQLNQSQRLERLGELAGSVAHAFNNLLSVIFNFAIFAKEKVFASGNGSPRPALQVAVKDMDRVVRAGESAAGLTHQLLAFAHREVVRPQSAGVSLVVAELEPLVSCKLGRHIEFITSAGKDIWPALMDSGQPVLVAKVEGALRAELVVAA